MCYRVDLKIVSSSKEKVTPEKCSRAAETEKLTSICQSLRYEIALPYQGLLFSFINLSKLYHSFNIPNPQNLLSVWFLDIADMQMQDFYLKTVFNNSQMIYA